MKPRFSINTSKIATNKLLIPKTANLKPYSGFTLIELLIAVTIIVILASMGLVAYRSASASARNDRRKNDLSQIQAALQMYAFENNRLPSNYNNLRNLLVPDYLDPLPLDPQGGNYTYQRHNGGADQCGNTVSCPPGVSCGYSLTADLENETPSKFHICGRL